MKFLHLRSTFHISTIIKLDNISLQKAVKSRINRETMMQQRKKRISRRPRTLNSNPIILKPTNPPSAQFHWLLLHPTQSKAACSRDYSDKWVWISPNLKDKKPVVYCKANGEWQQSDQSDWTHSGFSPPQGRRHTGGPSQWRWASV